MCTKASSWLNYPTSRNPFIHERNMKIEIFTYCFFLFIHEQCIIGDRQVAPALTTWTRVSPPAISYPVLIFTNHFTFVHAYKSL